MLIRSPIVVVLGHVDHGKTTLLDAIRKSRVAEKESGKITQMIGASYVSKQQIEALSKGLKEKLKINIIVPGLLFIDTPGHEAFTSLRERGGSIADIAVLVVDIRQGFQEQTKEALRILKENKVPFILALTKVDSITGWRERKTYSIIESLNTQDDFSKARVEELAYKTIIELSKEGFDGDLFLNIDDFTKKIALIPVSGKTGEGIAELLLLLVGLSQKYLKNNLYVDENKEAKGTILEVKEEKGLGVTLDAIIYDGVIKEKSDIFFLTKDGIRKSKIRALLVPKVSSNYAKEKYEKIKKVVAAAGVKIVATNLENALPGSPFSTSEESVKNLEHLLSSTIFESNTGVVLKADSLGSLEALIKLFKSKSIPIGKADVGGVKKEDVLLAYSFKKDFPFSCVIAFNVSASEEVKEFAKKHGIKIIEGDIIYKLEEDYQEFVKISKELEKKSLAGIFPAKIKALPGFFFRVSKPAIFGVEVLEGKLTPGVKLMNEEGVIVGTLKSIQDKGESLKEALKGEKVAISVEGGVLRKNIFEGQILYSYLREEKVEELLSSSVFEEEKEILEEIKRIIKKKKISEKLEKF